MGQFTTLDDVLGVLRRRFVLILGITLIGAALSLVYATSLPRSYETTAIIQVELSELAATGTTQSPGARVKNRLNLIRQQLMARDAIMAVIDELNLFANTPIPESEKIDKLREAVVIEPILEGADAWRPEAVPSGLLITVRWGDAEQAATIANTFLDRVLMQSEARRQAQVGEALRFFESEANRVGAKISALEAKISRFKQENAAALPDGVSALRSQLATLEATELEIERQIIGLKANSGRLREDALSRQINELEEQKALVGARIDAIEAALKTAPEIEREFNRLSRDLEQLQAQMDVITRRRAEAEMEQALESAQVSERFEVLEVALVPEYPIAPSRKKIAVAGTLLFLVLGAALAMVLEMLNPAIRTASQMERELGVVPIVTIPNLDQPGRTGRWRKRWVWLAGGLIALGLALWPLLQQAISWLGNRFSGLSGATAKPAPLRVLANGSNPHKPAR